MSIANYFNKLPKDAPLLISWKPSAEPPTKRTKRGSRRRKKQKKSKQLTAKCAQYFVLKQRYCKLVVFVSWISYRCCFFSYMRCPYSLIHVVSSDDPRCCKGFWDCCCSCHCHLSLPTMSWPHRECALAIYIVTGNNDRLLLEPANPCDLTKGNEFPESDASLELPVWDVAFWRRIRKYA